MKYKIFNIPKVGDVKIIKHHNAKRISIKIRFSEIPTITIPKLMTYKMGLMFAVEKTEWIIKSQQKIVEINSNGKVFFKNGSVFQTRFHNVSIKQDSNYNRVEKKDENIILHFSVEKDLKLEHNQDTIRQFLIKILRIEAQKYLPKRVDFWAQKYGFNYQKLFIKNVKTRWGSCSSVNNINLNLHIMRLPEHLSDFIILHELCHTIHKNHGVEFHKLLNNIVGGKEKEYDKQLKKYSTQF